MADSITPNPLNPSYQGDFQGYTGIIEIDGVWFIIEDGKAYYFDDVRDED